MAISPAPQQHADSDPSIARIFNRREKASIDRPPGGYIFVTRGLMTLRGLVAHVDYGPNVYRIVAYAPDGAAFAAQGRTLSRIVESFAPVGDSSVLDVEANRIRVVKVDRAMSLEEFARRYPSVVPVDELAVINQVDGARAQLDRGARLKRVIG